MQVEILRGGHVLRSARRMSFLEAIVEFLDWRCGWWPRYPTGGGDWQIIGERRGDEVILAGVVSRWQARMSGPGRDSRW